MSSFILLIAFKQYFYRVTCGKGKQYSNASGFSYSGHTHIYYHSIQSENYKASHGSIFPEALSQSDANANFIIRHWRIQRYLLQTINKLQCEHESVFTDNYIKLYRAYCFCCHAPITVLSFVRFVTWTLWLNTLIRQSNDLLFKKRFI